jgi:hypothetical protein
VAIPLLHERRTKFLERNAFLFAVLGAVSVGRGLERFLEAVGDEAQPEPGPETASRNVYVVLGALSLWRNVRAELERWRPKKNRAERRPRAASPLASPRVVLR